MVAEVRGHWDRHLPRLRPGKEEEIYLYIHCVRPTYR
jgi:hypothetical protein